VRGLWLIALAGLVLAPCMWAQRGGGHAGGGGMGHAGGGAPHAGFSTHGPAMTSHWSGTGNSWGNGVHFRSGFNNRFNRRRFYFVGWPWYYGYGYGYGYPYYDSWYPWDYGYSSVMDSNTNPYPAQYQDDYAAENTAQQAEIDRLEDEVDRLRDEREARAAQTQAPAKPETHEPTILVFNDKHTQEVQNYAVVGETLWVFTELRAVKIPLSSIDIDATVKANDAHGVPFVVPELAQ